MRPFKLRGYVVERLLGSGASGDVWRAHAAASGAPVALKRIAITSESQRVRADAEAALLCALDHPNLVRLHTVVPDDDALILVLDLAEGGSLGDLLAARGRLAPGEVITAVAPVAAALTYLHGEGVVHCDVSAGNVLFTGAGVPLLADVGVARLLGDNGDIAGTPAYVDPTVARGGVPGPASDVFMLGAVAFHALTGAPPWPDPDPAAALARAAAAELGDVRARLAAAGVAPEMVKVLGRATEIDPQRRGTAADLALDLRHSGAPVAVELAAGRARAEPQSVVRTGPRHAAAAPGRSRVGVLSDPVRAAQAPTERPSAGRPTFARPSEGSGAAGAPPPTRMVGPRPRPVIPRPASRRRPSLRVASVLGALALAGVILAAGLLWARPTAPAHEAAKQVQPPPRVETAGPSQSPASSPIKPSPAAVWADRLAALDAARTRAFAQRNVRLLRQVYVSGPLLRADAALLSRIVPPGCGLAGVRTTYSALRVAPRRTGAVIIATARLSPSRLLCAGRPRATAPGAGPARLRVEVVGTAAGLRIAAQRPA